MTHEASSTGTVLVYDTKPLARQVRVGRPQGYDTMERSDSVERSILRMISSPKGDKGQDIEINRWSGDRSRLQRRNQISRQNCGAPSEELSTPSL